MKASELVSLIAFGLVATFIITMMFRDWVRKLRIKRALTNRNQNDDEQFRRYFLDPQQADIAVRTRRVLANNLKLPWDGLTPTDRLNDDFNAELPANPDLFWELARLGQLKLLALVQPCLIDTKVHSCQPLERLPL